MNLTITAVYTAIFALLIIPMSMQITLRRIAIGNVALGDGNDKDLKCKREVLRNFCEYVPLGLVLLAAYELTFGSGSVAMSFGGLFLFSRVLHIIGLQHFGTPKVFAIAMVAQHSYFSLAAGMVLYELVVK